jgi:hypothetical protein
MDRARQVGAAALLAVCAFVGAETAARVEDWFRLGVPLDVVPDHDRDLLIRDSLGLRGRPGGRYQQWRLNAFGFRGPEITRRPAAGCDRVMVLGSSESFGYYEGVGREYPRQLADSLRDLGHCGDVVNGSAAGFTLPRLITLWDRYASGFGASIVLIYANPGFYLADPPPSLVLPPAPPIERDRRWWIPRMLERARDRIEVPRPVQRWRLARRLEAQVEGKPSSWFYASVPEERLELYRQHLDSLVRVVTAKGARAVLIVPATRFSDPPGPDDDRFIADQRQFVPRVLPTTLVRFHKAARGAVCAVARARGVGVVDASASLSGRAELFADAMHFTDAGAAQLGGLLARALVLARAAEGSGDGCGGGERPGTGAGTP